MLHLIAQNNPFDDLETFIAAVERPGAGEQRKVAGAVRQGLAESFTRQGSAAGPWAPLAPSTVIDRRRQGYGSTGPILVREGDLRATYTQDGAPDHVTNFQPTAVGWLLEVGSESDIAEFHEYGTAHMPARPVLLMPEASERRVLDTLDYMIIEIERRVLG